MTITQIVSEIKLLHKQDPDFFITENNIVYSRASLSFSKNMPAEYQNIVLLCLQKDWIRLVAAVSDSELAASKAWNKLKS